MRKKNSKKLACMLMLSLAVTTTNFGGVQFAAAESDAVVLSEESVQKNAQDVAALQKIIEDQVGKGAKISQNLDDGGQYIWNDEGRLRAITWDGEMGLTGVISFSGLTALAEVDCNENQNITSLDMSGCPELEELDCWENPNLTSLNVSENLKLMELFCRDTALSSLDVSKNVELTQLNCCNTAISSVDLSKNTELKNFLCGGSKIASLDLSNNTALTILECTKTPITYLDLRKNTNLTADNVFCDASVKIVRTDDDAAANPAPTQTPTTEPSTTPSTEPSTTPSTEPSTKPSAAPTTKPSAEPAAKPTNKPNNSTTTNSVTPAAVGTVLKDKNNAYQVLSADKKQPTVTYLQNLKKKATSVVVPEKISMNGITYTVTAIAPKAFVNNKKLKKVTIGKNIGSIGKNAFSNCKKLKKITIKSTKLKNNSVGKNAFKGTAKKMSVKVPKKQYKAYKKFLAKKGNKTIKVTK